MHTPRAGAVFATLTAFVGTSALAQQPHLLRDLNTNNVPQWYSSGSGSGAVLNGAVYVVGSHPADGVEIYRTDGTAAGTRILKDIRPGSGVGIPYGIAALRDRLYFLADDGYHNRRLWVSDGTVAGTHELCDCGTSPVNSNGRLTFFDAGGYVYFFGMPADNSYRYRLWRTDGTDAGTVMLRESTGWMGGAVAEFRGRVWFCGADDAHGSEVWTTDGTKAGTRLELDLLPGPDSSRASNFVALDDRVIFTAQDPLHGFELWVATGVDDAHMIVDLTPGPSMSYIDSMMRVGDRVAFVKDHVPWVTDGTAGGTMPLRAPTSAFPQPIVYGDGFSRSGDRRLTFLAQYDFGGRVLWTTDGTPQGTAKFHPTLPVVAALRAPGNRVYVSLSAPPWLGRFDSADPAMIPYSGLTMPTVGAGPPALRAIINNELIITASTLESGSTIWTTAPGNTLSVLRDLTPKVGFSSPEKLTGSEDHAYFRASTGESTAAIFSSDGTEAGTVQIQAGNYLGPTGVHGKTVFFCALPPGSCYGEPYASEGTPGSTRLLANIRPGLGSGPGDFTLFHDLMYFTASPDGVYRAIWKSDGTPAGTAAIGAPAQQDAAYLTALPNVMVYIAVNSQPYGRRVYVTDGTGPGTHQLAAIGAYATDLEKPLAAAGNLVYFRSYTPASGMELWCTDGTTANTRMIADLTPGPGDTPFRWMVPLGNILLFATCDAAGHGQIWRSDGTALGTVPVASMELPTETRWQRWRMVACGGRAYFIAATEDTGWELWVSDGTTEGTHIIRDLAPGPAPAFDCSRAVWLTPGPDGVLFFAATDGAHGMEVWQTDGTEQGTHLAAEVVPGPGGCDPAELCVANGRLFFSAYTDASGREPWVVDINTCYANCDLSAVPPTLNVADFACFLQRFCAGEPYANCDGSLTEPTLNAADFTCFLQVFANGCP